MQRRTAMIWNDYITEVKFFLFEEDVSRFNGVYINLCIDEELNDDLCELMYDEEGIKHKPVTVDKFAQAIRDGYDLIVCGEFP